MKQKKVKIGILKKGDRVISIWPEDKQISIAVKHKNDEVEIFRIEPDSNGLPRIDEKKNWTISFGNNEVDIALEKSDIKITTF